MEKIHSESSRVGESFAFVAGGFINVILFMKVFADFGIEPPLPRSPVLCLITMIMIGGGLLFCEAALLTWLHPPFIRMMQTFESAARRVADSVQQRMTRVFEGASSLLAEAVQFALSPVRISVRALWDAHVAPRLERRRQRAELRRLYEEMNAEGSFEDFVRDFDLGAADTKHETGGARRAEAPDDPFAAACALLGLPPGGGFTQAEFKARYQTLMKAVHPDAIGPNVFATQVNEARAVIKARKGWK